MTSPPVNAILLPGAWMGAWIWEPTVERLQASHFKDYSLIMAGVVISVIPLLLIFVFAGRRLVTGIMAGAVKG